MTTRLDYVEWDEISNRNQMLFKVRFTGIESLLDMGLLDSREKSLALTKLEESWMWVGKAIKVDQENRNKPFMEEDKKSEKQQVFAIKIDNIIHKTFKNRELAFKYMIENNFNNDQLIPLDVLDSLDDV